MKTLRRATLLLLSLLLASCGGARVPDQQQADLDAVGKMVEAAKDAHPNGKVVLVLPATVGYQGASSDQLAAGFKAGWKVRNAALVEHRLSRSSDSGAKEHPEEFRRFAATIGTLSAEDVNALTSAHPDARLFVSFCGLPQSWTHVPDGPKWIAFCPAGAKGGSELAATGALIAVVQPRPNAPPPGLDDFETFYSFDTPATLSPPVPAP